MTFLSGVPAGLFENLIGMPIKETAVWQVRLALRKLDCSAVIGKKLLGIAKQMLAKYHHIVRWPDRECSEIEDLVVQ